MANFENALQRLLKNEGGYVVDAYDPGGETYKGVARKMNSTWKGWVDIDIAKKQPGFPGNLEGNAELQVLIHDFYKINYWNRMSADAIANDQVAFAIFDFAVNAGVGISVSLAQKALDIPSDGVIGPVTIEAMNKFNTDHFIASFTVLKIARYIFIVNNRPDSKKYFFGWVSRALNC